MEIKSKFIKVRCSKCKNEQIVFGKSTTVVECKSCACPLTSPRGGKAKIRAIVLELLS